MWCKLIEDTVAFVLARDITSWPFLENFILKKWSQGAKTLISCHVTTYH